MEDSFFSRSSRRASVQSVIDVSEPTYYDLISDLARWQRDYDKFIELTLNERDTLRTKLNNLDKNDVNYEQNYNMIKDQLSQLSGVMYFLEIVRKIRDGSVCEHPPV